MLDRYVLPSWNLVSITMSTVPHIELTEWWLILVFMHVQLNGFRVGAHSFSKSNLDFASKLFESRVCLAIALMFDSG
jgi:hypothetical protein